MKQNVLLAKIDEAIKFWSHLVPAENDNEITSKVNKEIREILLNQKSQIDSLEKMKSLSDFICDLKYRNQYAHYVSNVFSKINLDFGESFNKILLMICAFSSCFGGKSETFWRDYGDGFYDTYLPSEDSFFDV